MKKLTLCVLLGLLGLVSAGGSARKPCPGNSCHNTTPTTTTAPTTTTVPTTTTAPTTTSSGGNAVGAACATAPSGSTITLTAGTYNETATCQLPCNVSLQGAGGRNGATVILGSADPLIQIQNCTGTNRQTVSGLKLDGQNKTAGTRGMNVSSVDGLTITDLDVENFKGTPGGNQGGGAINIANVSGLNLGNSVLRNSSSTATSTCSGTLGLGNLASSNIHDLVISTPTGYGVKDSLTSTSTITDTNFYNLDVSVGSTDCGCCATIAFELFDTAATNVAIYNSKFNGVVSLTDPGTGSTLASGYRYDIHNNLWTIVSGSEYAIELDQDSSHVHHNFFNGGLYPLANFTGDAKIGNVIDHNVVDNTQGPTAVRHDPAGVQNEQFFNNTFVMRQSSWRDGVFSLATGSTLAIHDNIFDSTVGIGDKLGIGLGSATIDHNAFVNLTARGTNVVAGTALPLSGGFPAAYTPPSGSAEAGIGAFAQGTFTVGP